MQKNSGESYWKAELDDGSVVTELDSVPWRQFKGRVRRLSMMHRGTEYTLPEDQPEYMRATTASFCISGGQASVESKWIGFRTHDGKIFRMRFFNDRVSVEVE